MSNRVDNATTNLHGVFGAFSARWTKVSHTRCLSDRDRQAEPPDCEKVTALEQVLAAEAVQICSRQEC